LLFRIDQATDSSALAAGSAMGNIEKIAAQHIRNLVIKSLSSIVKTVRSPPDNVEEYKQEYGTLGKSKTIISMSELFTH
jgi:hypothetical protein